MEVQMRWSRRLVGVLASLVSFSTGGVTNDEASVEGERGRAPTQRFERAGFAASGPKFYVWEEDSRQGRDWAAELALGARPASAGEAPREPAGLDRSET
jgi:hypothetical protein